MKTKIASIVMIIITIILSACSEPINKFPAGAWKLVKVQQWSGDTLKYDFVIKDSTNQIKMWSEGSFVFAGYYKEDTLAEYNCGWGTYSLTENRYEENVQYHTSSKLVGEKLKMLLELKNDTLVQTYPVDDNWKIKDGSFVCEKYIRTK